MDRLRRSLTVFLLPVWLSSPLSALDFKDLSRAAPPLLPATAIGPSIGGIRDVAAPPVVSPLAQLQGMEEGPRQPARFDGGDASGPPDLEPPAPSGGGWTSVLSAPVAKVHRATRVRSTAERWLERGLLGGMAGTVLGLIAWKVAPPAALLYHGTTALIALPLFFGPVALYRFYRHCRGQVCPNDVRRSPRSRVLLSAALGVALGVGAALTPGAAKGPLLQAYARVAFPELKLRYIHGETAGQTTIDVLSRNPEGRLILERLQDRGGRTRLPGFFVTAQPTSNAVYIDVVDAVALSRDVAGRYGAEPETVARDPALQRRLVEDNQEVLAHELVHDGQARGSARGKSLEQEYQAYIEQHFYVHERLKADPHHVFADSSLIGGYDAMLDDIDSTLHNDVDEQLVYKGLPHRPTDEYRAYRAKIDAGWAAHRVEGYRLLAERHKDVPALRRLYLEKARLAEERLAKP